MTNVGTEGHIDWKLTNEELRTSVEFWQKDSATAWDTCEVRRLEKEALSIQVAQLREALEEITYVYMTTIVREYGSEPANIEYLNAIQTLNTTVNPDEWIRKSDLECEGMDMSGTMKLYRIKETTR